MDKNEIKKMADLIEKITFVINCIELNKENIITKVSYIVTVNKKDSTKASLPVETFEKNMFIAFVREIEKMDVKVEIKSRKGTEIQIIKENGIDKYLRTKGDKDSTNDLVDSPECSKE